MPGAGAVDIETLKFVPASLAPIINLQSGVDSRVKRRGELFGMPPSGKPISMKDSHFFRFRDGKIVKHWNQVALA